MQGLNVIQTAAVMALPLLFAITVHEAAHGWMARRLGDRTAEMLGRLTLNPIKHIDPIGTVLVPAILLIAGGFIFGWAKPVPVDPRNLAHPRRDMAAVAAAGPMANLVMALIWALIAKLGLVLTPTMPWVGVPLLLMGKTGIFLNSILMVLNLLPLPPLDGGRVLVGLLPDRLADKVASIEPYGMFILVGLMITGFLGQVIGPPITLLERLLVMLVGI
ncbi:MAG TPA: site-2 protease family protein [Gammaproteobacteria bacterium]|jgi:Zn-dependent protease|nr:site-2 protease family protein [Gammaproteobacteria bacterium]